MRYILFAVAGLYGLLSIIAALYQMRQAEKRDNFCLMLLGGLGLLAAVALGWLEWPFAWLVAVASCAAIFPAIWMKGKQKKQLRYRDAAVYLALTLLVIVGFAAL
ncbi:MAG TPA: hypothetical protein IAC31_01495 [Candidatus Faecousia intestinigallinarum]|nr:hypothetical protein [Candidatus Faecousia intestinigallinarum]